jgi:hypothetical protein
MKIATRAEILTIAESRVAKKDIERRIGSTVLDIREKSPAIAGLSPLFAKKGNDKCDNSNYIERCSRDQQEPVAQVTLRK